MINNVRYSEIRAIVRQEIEAAFRRWLNPEEDEHPEYIRGLSDGYLRAEADYYSGRNRE